MLATLSLLAGWLAWQGPPLLHADVDVIGSGGAGVSGGTANCLAYFTSATAITCDTDVGPFIDATNNYIGIGSASVQGALTIGAATGADPFGGFVYPLRIVSTTDDGTAGGLNIAPIKIESNRANNNYQPYFGLFRSRSDATAPGGTTFGGFMIFESEGFTPGTNFAQARLGVVWDKPQTNDTTDQDSQMIFEVVEDGAYRGWTINSTGAFVPSADNSWDIGISATTRPRHLYLGSTATIGTTLTVGTTATIGSTAVAATQFTVTSVGGNWPVAIVDATDSDAIIASIRTFRSRSSATAPGAGFGSFLLTDLEGFTNGSNVDASAQLTAWEVAQTNDTTTRDSYYVLYTTLNNTLGEKWRVTSGGNWISTGADPVVSACGTTPAIVGSNSAGKVTIGTGATTSCTVTFANSGYTTNAPACTVTGDTPAELYAATTTTTVLTITSSLDMASDVISYQCTGIL